MLGNQNQSKQVKLPSVRIIMEGQCKSSRRARRLSGEVRQVVVAPCVWFLVAVTNICQVFCKYSVELWVADGLLSFRSPWLGTLRRNRDSAVEVYSVNLLLFVSIAMLYRVLFS